MVVICQSEEGMIGVELGGAEDENETGVARL
jgi:hypothetical protein